MNPVSEYLTDLMAAHQKAVAAGVDPVKLAAYAKDFAEDLADLSNDDLWPAREATA